MKTFNEAQMSDPWAWCETMIAKHEISSRMMAEAIDAPRSTVRALFNGTNNTPRYDLLMKILVVCIETENGVREWGPYVHVKSKPESKKSAVEGTSTEAEEWDFL